MVDREYSFELINADERLLLWLLVLLQQEGPGYMEQIEVDGALQKQVSIEALPTAFATAD